MHALDSMAEDPDPLFGIAGQEHVADIEVGPHILGIKTVDEVPHLQRAEQEFVPDVFNTQGHAGLFSGR